jgi:hypothetical protein
MNRLKVAMKQRAKAEKEVSGTLKRMGALSRTHPAWNLYLIRVIQASGDSASGHHALGAGLRARQDTDSDMPHILGSDRWISYHQHHNALRAVGAGGSGSRQSSIAAGCPGHHGMVSIRVIARL